MKKEALYRYFEGIASREEEEAVYRWLDVSPANEEELLREREFFDAMILVGNEEGHKLKRVHFFVREMLKVVAIVAITLACGGYYHLADKKELLSAMNTITVPMGQRMNLKLPDGTSVWLNACSEIVYPAIFSGGKREIRLTGEAYFEVTRQEKNPFVVFVSFKISESRAFDLFTHTIVKILAQFFYKTIIKCRIYSSCSFL